MDWSQQADGAAQQYQRFLAPAIFEPCAELLLDVAEVDTGAHVLDVACGTGVVSRAAAQRAGKWGAVTGLDFGAAMLEVARGLKGHVTYVEGDAAALPFADDEFDISLCQHGLMFFPDRATAVSELVRVVRPGGSVAIACWADPSACPVFAIVADALKAHMGEEPAALLLKPFSVGAAEIEELLTDAGAAGVKTRRVKFKAQFKARPTDFAEQLLSAGPVAPLFLAAPKEQQQAVKNQVAKAITTFVKGKGVTAPMGATIALAHAPG